MRTAVTSSLLLVCCLPFAVAACDQPKPATESSPAASSAAPAAAPTPAPAPTPAATAAAGARPEKIDTELTDARRGELEAKHPKAKGFVAAKELEDKLKKNKAIKDKKAALAAFDKLAKGKWLLFTGPAVNLTDDGFDMGVVYTPQLENDPIGMSRQFFEVTFKDVEGYSKDKLEAGDVVVVVAQYTGAGKAGPGHEAVASGAWK